MKTIAAIVAVLSAASPAPAATPLESLWKAFHEAAKAEKFDEPVKIYATDGASTKMCFIYKSEVWLFADGTLHRSMHAKMFNVDGINRIQYEDRKSGGVCMLWSDEELVLSIAL